MCCQHSRRGTLRKQRKAEKFRNVFSISSENSISSRKQWMIKVLFFFLFLLLCELQPTESLLCLDSLIFHFPCFKGKYSSASKWGSKQHFFLLVNWTMLFLFLDLWGVTTQLSHWCLGSSGPLKSRDHLKQYKGFKWGRGLTIIASSMFPPRSQFFWSSPYKKSYSNPALWSLLSKIWKKCNGFSCSNALIAS